MVETIVPVAATALGFSGLHFFLKKGPCGQRIERMYRRRLEAKLIPAKRNPVKLASQAEARLLNEIHNAFAIPLGVWTLFQRALNEDPMHGTTPAVRAACIFSAGYFFADLALVSMDFPEHGLEPLLHAAICLTYFGYAALGGNMQSYAPRVLLFEASTPLVHLRWLLHSLGLQETRLYKANGLAMMGAFLLCRVLWGSRLVVSLFSNSRAYAARGRVAPPGRIPINRGALRTMQVAGSSINVLNFFWFYKMLRGAFRVFFTNRH